MPGTNKAQIRALAAQNSIAVRKGFFPLIDIDKFTSEQKQHTKWVALSKEQLKLHQGPRGGWYRMVDGHKYYGPKNSFENPSQKSIEHFKETEREVRGSVSRKSSKSAKSKKSTKGKNDLEFSLGKTVLVIKTGAVGKIVGYQNTLQKVLVEKPDGKKHWLKVDSIVKIVPKSKSKKSNK